MVIVPTLSIQTHELREHGNVEYASISCDFCGKAFNATYQLRRHVMINHESTRQFICDICPKAFKQKPHLAAHRLIHTGEKSFHCKMDGCGKSFTKDWSLVQHERIHTGEKPYSCQPCGVAFVQMNSLTVHMNTHHKTK